MDALRNPKKISLLAVAILFLFTFFNLIFGCTSYKTTGTRYNVDECFTITRYLEKPVLGLLATVSVALLRPVSAASGAPRGRSGEDTGVDWLPGSPITSTQGQGSIDIDIMILISKVL